MYAVSPYKKVMYRGRKVGWIKFKTKQEAIGFIKKRRLKKALLYKKR